MQVNLKLPDFPVRLGWHTPISDEDFERAAMESNFLRLERIKTGDVIVKLPVDSFTSAAGSEITYQLRS